MGNKREFMPDIFLQISKWIVTAIKSTVFSRNSFKGSYHKRIEIPIKKSILSSKIINITKSQKSIKIKRYKKSRFETF